MATKTERFSLCLERKCGKMGGKKVNFLIIDILTFNFKFSDIPSGIDCVVIN